MTLYIRFCKLNIGGYMKKWKKLLWIYLILLAMVVVTMFSLWESSHQPIVRDYPEIEKEGVLRVTTEYSPTSYYIDGDSILGLQYELCQAIAKVSGLEVQLNLEMSLTKSFQDLESGEIDVIARNIPITTENKELYLFTDPIWLNKQVLVQRTEKANGGIKPIHNQLMLGQKTLYLPKGSPALLRIHNLEEEIGDTIYTHEDELYSDEQLIIMVAKGDIDFAVCDQQSAKKMKERFPQIDISTDISFTQLQSWAIRKESPILLDSLNLWLRKAKESDNFKKIFQHYYKKK